jgi:DNA repair protein RadD
MTELRPYQRDVIAEVEHSIAAGKRRIIAVAPTGAGKTIVAAAIINNAVAKSQRVLMLAHTREIIKQTSLKLSAYDIEHGIIQAGLVADPDQPVQVASIQTLWSRGMRRNTMPMPAANLLIIDECHHCPAETYRKIIAEYPNATLLGLTATPCRGDGRGLGGIFDVIVECPQVAPLIEQKYLVRTRVFAPLDPDLKGVSAITSNRNWPSAWIAPTSSATSSLTGTSTASAGKPFASPSTSRIRCTSATSLSSPG